MGVSTAMDFQNVPKECIFFLNKFINGEKSQTEVFGNYTKYLKMYYF